ncbi:MAG: hypothetical protein ACPGSD_17660 [Flavobacteriales bacterium]
MKTNKDHKSRRHFLQNISFAGLALGMSPLVYSKSKQETEGAACNPTTKDYYGEGPFYTANPPNIVNNQLASTTEVGTKIIVKGRIYNLDCSEYIPNTIVDVWHANDDGAYDNSGYNLRGKTTSDANGYYVFETIKPGKYLNGSSYRPSHIHFKISPPGFPTVTTQLYFEGDTSIAGDAAASITSGAFDATSRIVPLVNNADGVLEANWDIVINGDGIVGVDDYHIDKGMIYDIISNQYAPNVDIRYGVFKASRISLSILDVEGKTIDVLVDEKVESGKYNLSWTPQTSMPSGIYFFVLKVNDFQVHCLKWAK